ncbi:MAG: PTS sugar transporter subunit IIA [Gemmatimonadetes bacterium]|nr:PTS sugar transporter subunit IIA [Gemmatimonadota bacterium]
MEGAGRRLRLRPRGSEDSARRVPCPPAPLATPSRAPYNRRDTPPQPWNRGMRLREFLRRDFVLLRLRSDDVDGVIAEVAERAGAAGVGDPSLIREQLLERERLHPTVMGSGLAIPHATVPGLEEPVIGVALAGGKPVTFGPSEHGTVRVFFVLLSPPGHEREHVKLLARICRLVRHEGFMDKLEAATRADRVVEIIESVDALHV